jgi:hypothetical protein
VYHDEMDCAGIFIHIGAWYVDPILQQPVVDLAIRICVDCLWHTHPGANAYICSNRTTDLDVGTANGHLCTHQHGGATDEYAATHGYTAPDGHDRTDGHAADDQHAEPCAHQSHHSQADQHEGCACASFIR